MKIQRMYEGITIVFELSQEELRNAYEEKQKQYDIQDCVAYINELDGFENSKSVEEIEIELGAGFIEKMVYQYRHNIDKYDMDWILARKEAYERVINEKN